MRERSDEGTRRRWCLGGRRRWIIPVVAVIGIGIGVAGAGPVAAQDDVALLEPVRGFDFGGTGETIFEHTRASLRDPHFGMRFYLAPKVPGTLSPVSNPGSADADARAAVPDGRHVFWDVAFGERAPVLGWYDVHPTKSIRHARGFQLNLDAAAFLLLDFSAQSSAVINTDYRLGISVDLRPWCEGWDRLSFSVAFFHQSTHLGDEYTLSARTVQDSAPPAANPALPYRANPSYLAFPATISVDLAPTDAPQITARLYLGGTLFASSELPESTHPDFRAGLEFRYGRPEAVLSNTEPDSAAPVTPVPPVTPVLPSASSSSQQQDGTASTGSKISGFLDAAKHYGLGHAAGTTAAPAAGPHAARRLRRGARSYVLAYEALSQRKYLHDPTAPGQPLFLMGDGRWLTHHLMAMLVFNLDTERSTSNAIAVAVEFLDGRNQHGQLIEYDSVRTVALSLSYYW